MVGTCDGELSADQLVRGVTLLTEADVAEVAATVTPCLRELITGGLLH